jgi:hypothetical protein
MKTMLITFFDVKGIIHFECVPQGQIFNQTYYVEVLKRCVKLFVEEGLNFGPTTGFSTMAILQPTR